MTGDLVYTGKYKCPGELGRFPDDLRIDKITQPDKAAQKSRTNHQAIEQVEIGEFPFSVKPDQRQ